MFSLSPDVCPVVPCQRGLVHRAGKSITHVHQWRHQMTTPHVILSSLVNFAFMLTFDFYLSK